MHPIERLRYVAGARGADPGLVAREAATALAEMARLEPAGLLPACRRLVERHVSSGPVWWLSCRALAGADPAAAAREAARLLEEDPTADHLAEQLPEDTTVVIVGWPDIVAGALRSRGDVEVLVLDSGGDGAALARRLADAGHDAAAVPDAGVGPAVAVSGLVLLEAWAAGPSGLLAAPGSRAAAAVAACAGVPVWAVCGVGRVLPARMWEALLARFDAGGVEPWARDAELVPSELIGWVVSPDGLGEATSAMCQSSCGTAPELLREAG
ncbi:MAG: hypothetical protein ACR2KC_02090 [Acidimicrobiales bacterium]